MTDAEQRRVMDFILEQQAQLAVKLDSLANAQAQALNHSEERARQTDERWTNTEAGIRALLGIAEIHEREITILGESMDALKEAVRALKEAMQALKEQSHETDARLNVLVNTVERMLSEGRNGKS